MNPTATATASSAAVDPAQAETPVPCLTVVHGPHPELCGARLVPGSRAVVLGRDERVFEGRALDDAKASRHHARVQTAGGRVRISDLGSKNGTKVSGRVVGADPVPLAPGDIVRVGRTLLLFHERAAVPPEDANVPSILGRSDAMRRLRAQLLRYAARPTPVLVLGETGTGKELVAQALAGFGRPSGPFLRCNVSTLRGELVAATLFGHQKGVFTGATHARPGLFRDAHQGTLFLDEIGELEATVQAQLLRVLEAGEVVPLGATRPASVDVRVVAATHRDLPRRVAAGAFRADLLNRLDQLRVALPPLRERLEDLPLLAAHFAREEAGRDVAFDPAAMERLLLHPWPGNVRELRNAVTQLLADAPRRPWSRPLALSAAVLQKLEDSAALAPGTAPAGPPGRDDLAAALERTAGNVKQAAELLGVDRGFFYRLCKRHGVAPGEYR